MAVADIAVVNLPEAESKTPAPVVIPSPEDPPLKAPESPFYEPEVDVVSPPLYGEKKAEDSGAHPPCAPEPKATVSTPPEAKVEPKHSPADVTLAANLGIDTNDIDDMTPKQLALTIKHMQRFGQAAYDAGKKQVEPEKKVEPVEDSPFTKEQEDALLPEYIQPVKAKFKTLDDENKSLKARLDAIERQANEERRERFESKMDQVLKDLGPEVSAALDRSTAKGAEDFRETVLDMFALQEASAKRGKELSDKQAMEKAVRARGISVGGTEKKGAEQDAKIEEALKKRQEEFDAGALSKGGESRKKTEGVHEYVREKLKKAGAPVAEIPAENLEVEWPD